MSETSNTNVTSETTGLPEANGTPATVKETAPPARAKYALPAMAPIDTLKLEPVYNATPAKGDTWQAKEFQPKVLFPAKLADWGVPEERLVRLLAGFVAAHHVQSGLKSAWKSEKRSDTQRALLALVENGATLWGPDFVPQEREEKVDEVQKSIREKFAKWKEEGKLQKAAMLIGMAFQTWGSSEEMEAAYLAWKATKKGNLLEGL